MAMKNVVGLFDNQSDAQAALRDLQSAGFSGSDISFVANNTSGEYGDGSSYNNTARDGTATEAEEGAGFGATGGAVLGGLTGLLVGLGALAIPGIGPVVAAGTLASAIGSTALGAGLGAAAGGLTGALVGAGIPEQDANVYSEGVRRGGALITVQAGSDEQANRAADIMDRHNVVDIDHRGNEYRQSGWTGFDESAEPYNTSSTGYATTGSSNYSSTTDTSYGSTGDADTSIGRDDYARSSKAGTAGGALAGAATGAAIGSAGGPIGTVIGGVAGAVTGGGVGAAGDAAGAEATDDHADHTRGTADYSTTSGTAYGSATDYGTTDYNTNRTVGTTGEQLTEGGEIKVPIVQEELRVGKRQVETGGVRVYTRVQEVPVSEQVTVRDETIDIHRRAVDRPVSDADLANFREGTVEIREHDEEVIVDKQARVVEELHVKKNVDQRTETVQDTVRRTDVDVEQISGQSRTAGYREGYTETSGTTSDEGMIERGTSKLGNSVEDLTNTDLDRDGDVGQRDTRNNY